MHQDAAGMALLTSPPRRAIVETLSNLPQEPSSGRLRSEGLTAAELGGRLGLHATTVRFHVDQLLQAGLVLARDVREGVGRPRRRYLINPGTIAEVPNPDTYQILAELLSDTMLDQQSEAEPITAEAAAERWVRRHAHTLLPSNTSTAPAQTPGQFLAKIGVLIDLLNRWGYRTSVHTLGNGWSAEIDLTECPLRELALRNPAVACGLHRGLVRAAMSSLGEPGATIGLTPFIRPDRCQARVSTEQHLTEEPS